MKRRGYLVAGLALAVGAALVSGGAGGAAHRTAIVGVSPSQRPLLRTILAELAPTHLARVRLVRVPRGVELSAPVTGVRATWELLVAGAALHYRSAARHLPRVVAVGAGRASWPASNAGRRPPRATRPRVAAALRHM